MQSLRGMIATTGSIVVAGAGLAAVELAGELRSKDVTLIAADVLPLGPEARLDIRQTVVDELTQLKVKVMANTHVVEVSTTPARNQSLVLKSTDKVPDDTAITVLEADFYIPAFGVRPSIAFVPEEVLDPDGRVKVDRTTLHATGYANIFALGDAANAQTATGKHADTQIGYLAPAMQVWLIGRLIPQIQG
ncbi:unnamed protein product [Clonostachys rhizophaga]|uniref:FAD/NAD(P)-binding domain-containing protein n=1 Tax=Clonostachys rhizophaga TaxID=160324 RepID=A0A9N9V754_9HYPO|nr:unnamed protein product [Clonostachys rhizophaga]